MPKQSIWLYGPEVMGAFWREIERKYFPKWIARATHIYSDNNHLNICRFWGGNSKKYKELQICVRHKEHSDKGIQTIL